MKRYIPIIRDELYGLFDRDITGKIVLLNMDATQVSRMLQEVVEYFTKVEGKNGVILSYDRPANYIYSTMRKFWVPTDKLVFVDTASNMGGLDRKLPKNIGVPRRFEVSDPFDLDELIGVLRKALKDAGRDRSGAAEDGKEAVSDTSEDIMVRAEMGIYGLEGAEWSMMRHRIRERIRRKGLAGRDGGGREELARRRMEEMEEEGEFSAYTTDFLVIENLAVLMIYFGQDDVDGLFGALRSFISEGLCRRVVILLDRDQYDWVMENLNRVPDMRFSLETNIHRGITGYRLRPEDNGP